MTRIYQNHDDYDRKYTSKEFSCLNYYSKKMMKKMYPEHGYIIIGAVGEALENKAQKFLIDDKEYDFYNLRYNKFFYGIDGYIDCGNDEFIAVIKSKLTRNLLILLLTLLLVAGALFGGYLLTKDKINLDPNVTDYVPKIELPDNSDPNRISIPGYSELRMLADTDELYAALWNPETNPCYFKFTIVLENGDKVLYQSGLVPPGKAITKVKLNEKMKEGEYPVLIKMETFSLEDGKTPMNSGTSKSVIQAIRE